MMGIEPITFPLMGLVIPMLGIEPVIFSLDGFRDSHDGN